MSISYRRQELYLCLFTTAQFRELPVAMLAASRAKLRRAQRPYRHPESTTGTTFIPGLLLSTTAQTCRRSKGKRCGDVVTELGGNVMTRCRLVVQSWQPNEYGVH
jgi:hypothetical protein